MAYSSWLKKLLCAEVCLLAFVSGILAWRWAGPGLLMFFLVAASDLPRAGVFSLRPVAYCLLLVLFFGTGYCYTGLREPVSPPVPDWLIRASAVSGNSGEGQKRAAYLPVLAKVESCTAMPGGRLRIVLGGITPDPAHMAEYEAGKMAETYSGKAVWTWTPHAADMEAPLPGQVVEARLRFLPVRGFANPGTWDTETYWRDRGVFFKAWSKRGEQPLFRPGPMGPRDSMGRKYGLSFPDRIRLRMEEKRAGLHTAFVAALPEGSAGAGILPALIFGDRSQLTPGQVDLFARSTLAHSLALSGLHLGFAALAGYLLARGFGLLLSGLWLHISRPRLAMLLSLPVAALYLWLGQAPVSLIRAACMLFFWTILMFVRWPRVLLDGLFAALACILIVNPLALFDLSLQLSALSVGVIALCLPGLARASNRLFPPAASPQAKRMTILLQSGLRGAFVVAGISFCIQVALLPLSLRAFGTSGVLFPLNILWLPVLSIAVLPLAFAGLVAAWAGGHWLASGLLQAASLPCDALVSLLAALDRADLLFSPVLPRPHWLSMAGYWILCLALPVLAMQVYAFIGRYKDHMGFWRTGSSEAWASSSVLPGRGFSPGMKPVSTNMPGSSGRTRKNVFRLVRSLAPVLCGSVLFLLPMLSAWQGLGEPSVRLRLLDVGQGQAALVEWSGIGPEKRHGRALVDGGGFVSDSFDVGKAVLSPVLTDNALPRLDAVINSHPDTDHLAGMLFILEEFRVAGYYGNGDMASPSLFLREEKALQKRGLARQTLAAGDVLPLAPGLWFEIVWPDSMEYGRETLGNPEKGGGEKRNNASLVMRLVWQGRGLALLCGDAEKPALRELTRRYRERAIQENTGDDAPGNRAKTAPSFGLEAEVLVLPHHGAAGSLVPAFYDAVKPDRALAACGFANRWGYPAHSVVTALEEREITLHSTAGSGQITVLWREPEARAEYYFTLP